MKENKRKTTLLVMAIAVLTLSVIAGTYAFFTAAGNANASNDIQATTVGNLTMTLSDDSQLGVSGAIDPQNLKFTTYLKVENGGQGPQYVRLMFKNLVNTYSDYLVYSLDEVQNIPQSGEAVVVKNYKDKVVVPKSSVSTNAELANGVLVQGGTTANDGTITPRNHYYRVTIEYLYSDTVDQSSDLTKQFVTEFTMELGSAVQYTVTYNVGSNGSAIANATITGGNAIGELPTQNSHGKTITGWYSDSELTTPVTSATPVSNDMTLYAKWENILDNLVKCVDNNNAVTPCETITTGTKIKIGTEKFYVISNNSGTIRALAEYNLNVGANLVPSATEGIQHENARGFVEETTYPNAYNSGTYYGTLLAFSTAQSTEAYTRYNADGTTGTIAADTGWTNYNQSAIKTYVDNYKTLLNGASYANGAVTNTDLISFPELTALGCSDDDYTCNNSTYSWVKTTTYWSGSAYSNDIVWSVGSDGEFCSDYCEIEEGGFGVRPVITIAESSF